jgi:hypothetical protein
MWRTSERTILPATTLRTAMLAIGLLLLGLLTVPG